MALPALIASAYATIVLLGGICIDHSGVVTRNCRAVVTSQGVAISRSDSTLKGADVVTIDAAGLWIVPGFVDNHVHLGHADADPKVWTRAGVTEIVDNGSTESPRDLAYRFEGGPHVYACGPIITRAGGYPALGEPDAPALEVSGAEDAGRKTAELIGDENPDSIKIAIDRGFLSDVPDDG